MLRPYCKVWKWFCIAELGYLFSQLRFWEMDQFTSSCEKMGRHLPSWFYQKDLVSVTGPGPRLRMDNFKSSVTPSIGNHCENHLELQCHLGLATKYNLVHVLQNIGSE